MVIIIRHLVFCTINMINSGIRTIGWRIFDFPEFQDIYNPISPSSFTHSTTLSSPCTIYKRLNNHSFWNYVNWNWYVKSLNTLNQKYNPRIKIFLLSIKFTILLSSDKPTATYLLSRACNSKRYRSPWTSTVTAAIQFFSSMHPDGVPKQFFVEPHPV